mgnify:CR=1 FL=1
MSATICHILTDVDAQLHEDLGVDVGEGHSSVVLTTVSVNMGSWPVLVQLSVIVSWNMLHEANVPTETWYIFPIAPLCLRIWIACLFSFVLNLFLCCFCVLALAPPDTSLYPDEFRDGPQ